ncbi:MAG: TetR/AcrR family transcriptional regulator [Verrucomicrobia bacterium]|nr:TetR/AcrR family transcriptional regulator [Verrucomicrobiota bacterium]
MNERSFIVFPMPPAQADPVVLDRPTQILDAAVACFAKRGFHQASMHDISAEAGISVGLIYRYFQNKEAVIAAMADRHKKQIQEILERARQAPSLRESLETLFTAHCGETEPQVTAAFVVDLFAEASRNQPVAELVRDVCEASMNGVTNLIARSPEAKASELTPREMAELIFAVNDGMLLRGVLRVRRQAAESREHQLEVVRNLWRIMFKSAPEQTYA